MTSEVTPAVDRRPSRVDAGIRKKLWNCGFRFCLLMENTVRDKIFMGTSANRPA